MKVYAVYRIEKDGYRTFCVAWPDVWNARHSVLSLDEELKLDHEWVECQLFTMKTGDGSVSSQST